MPVIYSLPAAAALLSGIALLSLGRVRSRTAVMGAVRGSV
jgi:hypothetical protein